MVLTLVGKFRIRILITAHSSIESQVNSNKTKIGPPFIVPVFEFTLASLSSPTRPGLSAT